MASQCPRVPYSSWAEDACISARIRRAMGADILPQMQLSRDAGQKDVGNNKRTETREEMNIHVHVYKVIGKAEITLERDTVEQAQSDALAALKKVGNPRNLFGESDCRYIAMAFKATGGPSLGQPKKSS